MNLIMEDDEVKEILISDIVKSQDKGLVIIKGENQGKRDKGREDLIKEITAIDALEMGPSKAALINGTEIPAASRYSNAHDIADDDTRARVLSRKFDIANTATTKLMETLGLLNPNAIEKEVDKFKAASMLAGIVEKISSKERGNQEVHLHLYAPKQKAIETFEVIEVN